MKKILTKEDFKNEVLKGEKYFIWKKKRAKRYIIDFVTIMEYDENKFKTKEFSLNDELPWREEISDIEFAFANLMSWEVYLLTEKETSKYFKKIMARKIEDKTIKVSK